MFNSEKDVIATMRHMLTEQFFEATAMSIDVLEQLNEELEDTEPNDLLVVPAILIHNLSQMLSGHVKLGSSLLEMYLTTDDRLVEITDFIETTINASER